MWISCVRVDSNRREVGPSGESGFQGARRPFGRWGPGATLLVEADAETFGRRFRGVKAHDAGSSAAHAAGRDSTANTLTRAGSWGGARRTFLKRDQTADGCWRRRAQCPIGAMSRRSNSRMLAGMKSRGRFDWRASAPRPGGMQREARQRASLAKMAWVVPTHILRLSLSGWGWYYRVHGGDSVRMVLHAVCVDAKRSLPPNAATQNSARSVDGPLIRQEPRRRQIPLPCIALCARPFYRSVKRLVSGQKFQ